VLWYGPVVMGSGLSRRPPAIRAWSVVVGGWGVLGSAACATTFAVSLVPALPTGRDLPLWLWLAFWLLSLLMVPGCSLAAVPVFVFAGRALRRTVPGRRRWVTAWVIAVSAAAGIEALFVYRLARLLTAPFGNLSEDSWHALYFAIAYLTAGAAMAGILAAAGRSAAAARSPATR
jgi:hypothetical protein